MEGAGSEGSTGPVRLASVDLIATKFRTWVDYNNNTYFNVKSATVEGLEWTGNFTTGPIDHRLTLQYVDPRDDETDQRLYRRAKQQVKYELSGEVYRVGVGCHVSVHW